MRDINPKDLVAIIIFLTLATINVLLIKILSDCI
jgi:hypothetical protein